MADPTRKNLIVGITYVDDALLLVPNGEGFDLPVFYNNLKNDNEILLKLNSAGFNGAKIISKLDPIEHAIEGGTMTLCPIVFTFASMAKPFQPLPLDPKPEALPVLVSLLFWRLDTYGPAYQGLKRSVPFLPAQANQVDRELACLKYHAHLISPRALYDFRLLCESPASIRRINEAFVAICNEYHINPNDLPSGYRPA